MHALKSIRKKYLGIEIVITYTMPRPGSATRHAIAVVSTLDQPRDILLTLMHGAMEIKEQMIDPFTVGIGEKLNDA